MIIKNLSPSIFKQIRWLAWKNNKNMLRNPYEIKIRLIQTIVSEFSILIMF